MSLSVPTLPKLPSVPSMPNMSSLSTSIPSIPNMPTMSSLPSLGSLPNASSLPDIGSSFSSMPDIAASDFGGTALSNATNSLPSMDANFQSIGADIGGSVSGLGNAASAAIPSSLNPTSLAMPGLPASLTGLPSSLSGGAASLTGGFGSMFGGGAAAGSFADAVPKTLAVPTFSSGPNDKLASVDVYATTNASSTINSIQAIVPAASSTALAAFKGSGTGTADLGSIVGKANSALGSIDRINPLSMLQQKVPAMFSGARALPPHCGGSLLNGILGDLGKSKFKGLMHGKQFKLGSSCAIGVANLMNSMAKANGCGNIPFSFPDPTALLTSLSNMIKSALTLGIPDAFRSAICGLTNLFSIDKLAGGVAGHVAAFSDLSSLKSMAMSTTAGSLMCTNPNLISNFSKNFSSKAPGASGISSIADYKDLTTSYDTLDPEWDRTSTDGNGDITDLSEVCDGSDDFYQTISDGVDDEGYQMDEANGDDPMTSLSDDSVPNQDLLYASSFSGDDTDVNGCLASDFPITADDPSFPDAEDPITANNTPVDNFVMEPDGGITTPAAVEKQSSSDEVGRASTRDYVNNPDGSRQVTRSSTVTYRDGTVSHETLIKQIAADGTITKTIGPF